MSHAFTLIVNPASGGGTASEQGVELARHLRDGGADTTLDYSKGMKHTQDLAAEAAASGRVVIAVGGDGMARSVAGPVVAAGGLLGLAPGGRGNDFVRQLGLPTQAPDIAKALLDGRERAVDVIDADGEIVLGSVYAGIDSLASQIVNKTKRIPRKFQYQYAAVRALATCKAHDYTVTVDGVKHEATGYTVIVANSGYYGSGMHMAPMARVDDGALEVVVLRAASKFKLLRSMPKLYDGSHIGLDEVLLFSGAEVRVEAEGVTAFADGDYLAELPVTARVRPGALRILC